MHYSVKQKMLDIALLAKPDLIFTMAVAKFNPDQCTPISRVATCLQNGEGTNSVSGCNPSA